MVAILCAPVDVQIELTQACNWRCCHCYNYWRSVGAVTHRNKHLSRNQLRRIVDELSANQVPSVTITGGEPFVRRNEMFALLEMLREARIHPSINSNLSLVREEDVEKLASEHSGVSILFSLLSANAKQHERLAGGLAAGTHAQVLGRAASAISHGVPVSMNMVLMRENLAAMEETARLAKQLGVRTFCATKALPNVQAPQHSYVLTSEEVRQSLLELMRIEREVGIPVDVLGCYPRCLFADTDAYRRFSHRTCVAGCTTATIGADGNIRACSHTDASYGNIFEGSLQSAWQNMEGWRQGAFIPNLCHGCPVVNACRGGCRVNTLTPDLHHMDIHASPHLLDVEPAKRLDARSPKETVVLSDKVVVNSQVGFRTEAFGALLYTTSPFAILLVNHGAAKFLRSAIDKETIFDLASFLKASGTTTEDERKKVTLLYNKLVRKNFLTVLRT